MLKNLCQLEHVVSDKICRFICDNDTDINIIKEALFQFQKFIGTVEDAAKAQQTTQPVDPAIAEVPVAEAPVDPVPVATESNQQE